MNNCKKGKHCCSVDFEDDDYTYIIDELKSIRQHIDKTINLLEKRIEKDNIIEEVLSTDYEDEDDNKDINIDEYICIGVECYVLFLAYFNNYFRCCRGNDC